MTSSIVQFQKLLSDFEDLQAETSALDVEQKLGELNRLYGLLPDLCDRDKIKYTTARDDAADFVLQFASDRTGTPSYAGSPIFAIYHQPRRLAEQVSRLALMDADLRKEYEEETQLETFLQQFHETPDVVIQHIAEHTRELEKLSVDIKGAADNLHCLVMRNNDTLRSLTITPVQQETLQTQTARVADSVQVATSAYWKAVATLESRRFGGNDLTNVPDCDVTRDVKQP